MVETRIQSQRINVRTGENTMPDAGAELIFWGHVRQLEDGKEIIGLEYEHYDAMASKMLHTIAEKALRQFDLKNLLCIHRVGFIPVGEASLFVQIWSKHRDSALQAMEWFIGQLKQDVPIWKWGVKSDKTKFPAEYNIERS